MIVALLLTTVLLALSMGLVVLTNIETAVAANFGRAGEALQAADAGIEIAVARLSAAEWAVVLSGVEPPPCGGPDGSPVAPTGFYRTDRWSANDPVWRLYACGSLRDQVTGDAVDAVTILAIWLADDPSEADDDPILDTNQRLTVRVEAFGPAGAHAAIEATVARAGPEVRILSWRVLR
jgi:hypothetical protein